MFNIIIIIHTFHYVKLTFLLIKNKWNACQSILVGFFFIIFSSDKINQLENKTKENQGEISII